MEVCANLCKLAAHVQTWSQLFRLCLFDAAPGMAGTTGGLSQSSVLTDDSVPKNKVIVHAVGHPNRATEHTFDMRQVNTRRGMTTTNKGFRGKRRRKVPKEMKLCQVLRQVQLKAREAAKSPGREEIKFKATGGSWGLVGQFTHYIGLSSGT